MQTTSATYKALMSGGGLVPATEDTAPYLFRKSGGSTSVPDVYSQLNKISGGTICWNQIASLDTNLWTAARVTPTTSTSDNSYTLVVTTSTSALKYLRLKKTPAVNHIYCVTGRASTDNASYSAQIGLYANSGTAIKRILTNSTSFVYGEFIAKANATTDYFALRAQNSTSANVTQAYKNIHIIDLTEALGPTVADYIYSLGDTDGMAWLKKYLPLLENGYYPYDAGSPQSVNISKHKMVGFNAYNNSTGTAKLLGGVQYQISGAYTSISYLNEQGNSETLTPDADGKFTPTLNGVLTVSGGDGTTTCVHIVGDGSRDGEFKAYTAHEYSMDNSVSLRGRYVLDADNNLVPGPDGDTYEADGTVTRNYGIRAYESGDESDTTVLTNGTNTLYKLAAPTTETAISWTNPQTVDAWGTEEFIDYGVASSTRNFSLMPGQDTEYLAEGQSEPPTKEVQVVIADDYTYGEDKIIEMTVSSALFSENTLSFGGTVSKKLNLRFYPGANRTNIPTMAKLVPQVRLNNGTQTSEWLDKGTYFIDTRKYDPLTGIMEIEAYDAMLKAEEYYILNDPGTWPRTMSTVVSDIASRLGVTVDSRSTIGNYNVQLPIDYTMREVLSYIAAANGGNFVITWENKLRLIRFFDTTDSTNLYNNCSSFVVSDSFPTISKVVLDISDDTYVEAGDTTGYTITAKCPWATQAMANALLTSLSGMSWHYLPFTADNATLDPSMELGDYVTIASTKVMLCSQDIFFDALFCSDITAPVDEEINHEYPYETSQQRDIVRRVKTAEASIEVLGDQITLKVSAGDIASTLNQTAQSVLIQASKIDLSGYATFSSLSTAGQTTINGSNITTGTINASLIDTSTLRVEEVYYKSGSTFYRIVHGETSGQDIGAVFGLQNMSNSIVSLMGNNIQFLDGINTTAKGIEIQMSSKTIDFWPSGDWVLGSNSRSINGAFFDYVYLVTTTTAHGLLYASGNHLYYEDPGGTRHTIV